MLNSLILALSVSIDSLGIGITYGIRNTKILFQSKLLLFFMSLFFTILSYFIGSFISSILSEFVTKILSSAILFLIGILIIVDPIPFDFNHSLGIDIKEAFFLGITLSLDSVCVGISSSIGGFYNLYFPVLVSTFQLVFLSTGIFLGKKIIKTLKVPDKLLNIISGILLIFFSLIKLI